MQKLENSQLYLDFIHCDIHYLLLNYQQTAPGCKQAHALNGSLLIGILPVESHAKNNNKGGKRGAHFKTVLNCVQSNLHLLVLYCMCTMPRHW